MTQRPSPSRGLAAFLAAALFALAAGPAVAAVADALGPDCCADRCAMAEHAPQAPADAPACCVQAPATAPDAATLPAPTAAYALVAPAASRSAAPPAAPRAATLPRDAGPPPGLRRHLALSVWRV